MSKSILVNFICKALGKGIGYACCKDLVCRDIFLMLPKDLNISLGIMGDGEYLHLRKTESGFCFGAGAEEDLKITFKSRKSAKLVLLGGISVAESFARHDILLEGNINTAVLLVRIIDRVEYYLFPRLITRKFLPRMQKEFASLKMYGFVLFGNLGKVKIEGNKKAKSAKSRLKKQKSSEKPEKTDENLQNVV